MGDAFSRDIDFGDLDFRMRSQRPRVLGFDGCDNDDDAFELDIAVVKIFLVPFWWWKDVLNTTSIEGVLYSVSYNKDTNFEIVLDLSKTDKFERSKEGFSGLEYAIITEATWLQTVNRHNDLSVAAKDFWTRSLFRTGDVLRDAFPLLMRLSWKTESLIVKVSQMDNLINFYKRACNIFISESESLHIWRLSGQIAKFFVNGRNGMPNDSAIHLSKEILLVFQVSEFSNSNDDRYRRNDEMADQPKDGSSHGGIAEINEVVEHSHLTRSNSSRSGGSYRGIGSFGLTGLQNLGNTCYMNSAIQCLVHTQDLVDYFLGDYQREINRENQLGEKGELALAFGELLRKLWSLGPEPFAPSFFKLKLSNVASQFSDYNQHDSQEFLAFLLDGLHEDLNRVKCKPDDKVKDPEGRADEEVAEEYWQNHLARNDSIIVDLYQGQYRSKLVCSVCNKVAVTFDPFMYLSLPLPSPTMWTISLTVFSTDGITLPSMLTITVLKCGILKDLIDCLSTACSLGDDEIILLAEIYRNHICCFLEDPSYSLDLIQDEDRLVAYRLPKGTETSPLVVVFMHQQMEKYCYGTLNPKIFGIPLVASLSDGCYGSDIRKQFLKVLNPFLMPTGDISNEHASDADNYDNEVSEIDVVISTTSLSDPGSDRGSGDDTCSSTDFQFYTGRFGDVLLKMDEPIIFVPGLDKNLEVHVLWPTEMMKKYDTCRLSSLPEVSKPKWLSRHSVSLYECLEAFLKEEPLGPKNMWDCPSCKKFQQASIKLDLWRLPKILVIHLKRFSYSEKYKKKKLETYIDFPTAYMDFSSYIAQKNSQLPSKYMLYAISNHYGGTDSGHYTAFVLHEDGMWYEFNDGRVVRVCEAIIKTSAAYVLFYRRVVADA